MSSDVCQRSKNESSENDLSFSIVHRKEAEPIVFDGLDDISSVALLIDGKHVVSNDVEGKIRRWRIKDGKEVGMAMDARSGVLNIAVSRDGKVLVSGTKSGRVTVWNAENHSKVTEFKGHLDWVRVVDVSPDATKIVTGSDDETACVWSLSTGKRLRRPLQHDNWVVAAKFSPDGHLIVTATWERHSVRVYDSQNRSPLVKLPIKVNQSSNQSLAWASDSKQLFALSHDGYIHRIDVFAKTTLSKWRIHSSNNPTCIALVGGGTFIVAAAGSSVSFWDTTSQEQIGTVIEYTHRIWSMALSSNYDLVTSGDKRIMLQALCDIIPSHYVDNKTQHTEGEKGDGSSSSNERTANLEKTIQGLRNQLAESQREAHQEKDILTQSLHAQAESSNKKIARLEKSVRELTESQLAANQEQDCLNETISSLRANLRTRDESSSARITHLEQTIHELRVQLADAQREADGLIRINHAHEQKHQCESLYAQGHIQSAAECLFEIANTVNEDVKNNTFISNWLAEFKHRCITTLERVGDEALSAEKWDAAVASYSIALSLGPSIPDEIMTKWVSSVLKNDSAQEVLGAASKFKVPRFVVYRVICDILEQDGRLTEAVECFRQIQNELPEDAGVRDGRAEWKLNFQRRCAEKLEKLGDVARDSKEHDVAIGYYSNALSLDPTNSNILLKQSEEDVELDPSSHNGYESKHAALHGMGRHREAFEAFRMMLSRLEKSLDPHIRELRNQYVDATATIQEVVEETIRGMPRVLIDTTTGHLYDKAQQAAAFEELPIYDELRSSMTTRLDRARIEIEVKEFYRYVMLSHRWQPHEPTFQTVENISIYGLPESPGNSKVQKFCELVRSLCFQWAWSDTCCVNQKDKGVQQESVVAMFRWYHGSSLMIVHLLGVLSESQEFGCLWRSIWNTRGWTYQEYIASKAVQFYTEDWKPYLGLDIFNHKESPIILAEMEQAMNLATHELATLEPGLDRVREKLYLASRRRTTREEDIAYSLFGIFKVPIPVIYGEGNQAVGRLLEYVLTRSGDVTLLAWTGRSSGSHHTYLPADLTVYSEIVPLHVPRPMETAEMDGIVMALLSSSPDPSLTEALYRQLNSLPPLSLFAGRLTLHGIVFPLSGLVPLSDSDPAGDLAVYHATSPILGDVEFKTTDKLSGMESLLLIHPWISPLLDQDFSRGVAQFDLATRALRLVARLRQPFGALLLATQAREQYRRVATDSLIMVRVREETSLTELMDGIRTVHIQ